MQHLSPSSLRTLAAPSSLVHKPYFEKQANDKSCDLHALNNAVQQQFFSPDCLDLIYIKRISCLNDHTKNFLHEAPTRKVFKPTLKTEGKQ